MTGSIRSRLLALLMAGLFVVWATVAVASWWLSRSEVHELFDAQLAQIARLIAVTTAHESEEHDLDGFEIDLHSHDYQYSVVFQVWGEHGHLLMRAPGAPRRPIAKDAPEGYSNAEFGGESWRVFTLSLPQPPHRVQVAHANSVRDALIRKFVLNTMKPFLLALPLFGLLWWGIERGLAPLRWVAREIAGRESSRLDPMPARLAPAEIVPLVDAINALFLRLRDSLDRYRRFTADVAHELRTPIAGTVAQLHAVLGARNDEERRHGLEQVPKGLQRLSHTIDQLLALARAEPESVAGSFAGVDMNARAAEVVSELTPRALDEGVDIELRAERPVRVNANAKLIEVLIGNLVTNAMRATPQGGLVSVGLEPGPEGPRLTVEDTGPGIPDHEKARVLDRFHRLPETGGGGSGLGLSIVQAVADAHGAEVILEDRVPGLGLRVVVGFPAPEAEENG